MHVIDVSGWPDAMDEPLGTKPKQWLRHQPTINVAVEGNASGASRVRCDAGRLG